MWREGTATNRAQLKTTHHNSLFCNLYTLTILLCICSDARENFEFNKLSLARKAEKEDNLKVQLLLRRDMKFLDDIQLQMSTAREFMFAYRLTHESEDGALATLNRIEKHISDQGFEVKRANKEDIKRFWNVIL